MFDTASPILWLIFNLFVILILFFDLYIFNPTPKKTSIKESVIWSIVWFLLAIGFYLVIDNLFNKGHDKALEFLTGYLIEKSLSVDNIFVFVMIFLYFKVPIEMQHRVLFWGIIGAVIFRGIFIYLGANLIAKFSFINYIFGAFLIVTGIKLLFASHEDGDFKEGMIVTFIKKVIPTTEEMHGKHFFIRQNKKTYMTPLGLVMVTVAVSDIMFAIDSVPAIFAITKDPFIVYTSNVFAIMGLRALFFLLAGVIRQFYYLTHCISFLLVFVGIKMGMANFYHIPTYLSLSIILGSLTIAIIASIIKNKLSKSR